jgi:hypothetical protein
LFQFADAELHARRISSLSFTEDPSTDRLLKITILHTLQSRTGTGNTT